MVSCLVTNKWAISTLMEMYKICNNGNVQYYDANGDYDDDDDDVRND